jgi:hypothetical protein
MWMPYVPSVINSSGFTTMEHNGVDSGYAKKKEDMQNPFNLIIVLVAEP